MDQLRFDRVYSLHKALELVVIDELTIESFAKGLLVNLRQMKQLKGTMTSNKRLDAFLDVGLCRVVARLFIHSFQLLGITFTATRAILSLNPSSLGPE